MTARQTDLARGRAILEEAYVTVLIDYCVIIVCIVVILIFGKGPRWGGLSWFFWLNKETRVFNSERNLV